MVKNRLWRRSTRTRSLTYTMWDHPREEGGGTVPSLRVEVRVGFEAEQRAAALPQVGQHRRAKRVVRVDLTPKE